MRKLPAGRKAVGISLLGTVLEFDIRAILTSREDRWVRQPMLGNINDTMPALRTLNVRSIVPVDLNSVLCRHQSSTSNLFTG